MLNYEQNPIRTHNIIPSEVYRSLFAWTVAFSGHCVIFLLLQLETNFLITLSPPVENHPKHFDPIYEITLESEPALTEAQDIPNIFTETEKDQSTSMNNPQNKPTIQPLKKPEGDKPVNPDISYEQLLGSHIDNISKLVSHKPTQKFNIKIHLTIDGEGNIINHKLFASPTPEIIKYCKMIFELASPVPKPPLKDLKNNKSTYRIGLHNSVKNL